MPIASGSMCLYKLNPPRLPRACNPDFWSRMVFCLPTSYFRWLAPSSLSKYTSPSSIICLGGVLSTVVPFAPSTPIPPCNAFPTNHRHPSTSDGGFFIATERVSVVLYPPVRDLPMGRFLSPSSPPPPRYTAAAGFGYGGRPAVHKVWRCCFS